MEGPGELQCVGRLEIAAEPKPAGFLCVGSLPVPTDSAFPLVPSPHPIGAPRYQMLPAETDLNTLPLLSNLPEKGLPPASKSSEGFHYESGLISQNLSRKCESLAVSGLTEYGDEIDVVAPTDILKQIFRIPYSKSQLSIAVHRIGDTLVLNTGPDVEEGEKVFRRQSNQPKASDPSIFLNFAMHSVRAEACDCPPGHQPSSGKQTTTTILPGHFGHRDGPFVSTTTPSVGTSQYFDQNVNNSRKSSPGNRDSFYWGAQQKKQKGKRADPIKRTSQIGEKPKCPVQESERNKRVGNNGFMRIWLWQFHNFRMLLGSDLLILSNEKYVAVSLHLWDVSRQVTPLTWLEAWLDNIMTSVPELAICYHRNGVVQGYELLKTEDIFLLKGVSDDGAPAFYPQVVLQNGLSVLRFLQDNCKQDPGAYWLYKGADEDAIQLFDLSIIPENQPPDDHHSGSNSLPALMSNARRESLFSLGTLLYRVAHRLSLSKAPDSRAKCAKFFKKCLDFLSEQDHLVVRAYAHEQFARLILKCYEELELTSDPFLLESEVTVTDLENDTSTFSLEMLASKPQEEGPEAPAESYVSDCVLPPIATETEIPLKSTGCSGINGSLELCQIGTSHVVRTVADPVSSKLAAIHHISQAIKSLRWNRQLQNTRGDFVDSRDKIHEKPSLNFLLCSCGEADCVEVCDIREWLPKSKMDHKMWKLVLLLGESYLALGEAFKEDGQLHRVLKVIELACLVYGSMPQHLENSKFVSSMSTCLLQYSVVDDAELLKSKLFDDELSAEQCSPTYLFWAKAWMLVGDVYAEHHRLRGNEVPVKIKGTQGIEPRMSDEVVKEVKRLKKKLGKDMQNCSTCSLINCSCQSDRAISGNSASSSSADHASYGKKKNRRSLPRNPYSHSKQDEEVACVPGESCLIIPKLDSDSIVKFQTEGAGEALVSESSNKDSSKGRRGGGIFKFLEGPKLEDVEYNLSTAMHCFDAAKKAMFGFLVHSEELSSILKKKGWASNELGRYRLANKDLVGAESAFADAVNAFREVSDHTNIILINCNLGHGRRALAEELVSKMDELKKYDVLQHSYLQAMKTAKLEYFNSLNYYSSAKRELSFLSAGADKPLYNEVCTQYAHTYLRLGMLLAKESISSESYGSRDVDEVHGIGTAKENISASDAFRGALSIYESLGELRKQEAAFGHFQLACYHRDLCLKFLHLYNKESKRNSENKHRQKAKRYGSLAEKNWHKAMDFYSAKTHPNMFLTILMEQSALSLSLSNTFHSSTALEAALIYLLEGRHTVEDNKDHSPDIDLEAKPKFWDQLQALLKSMLQSSLSLGGTSRSSSVAQSPCYRAGDATKLRELYRMSLKSTRLGRLHSMQKLWIS